MRNIKSQARHHSLVNVAKEISIQVCVLEHPMLVKHDSVLIPSKAQYLRIKRDLNRSPDLAHWVFLIIFIYLSIGCAGSFCCASFLQLQRTGATLCCGVQASHCGGFSCSRAWAPGTEVSVVATLRFSSCGLWAQLLHDMWNLPGLEFEPMSPALKGGVLTTAPPGKPQPTGLQMHQLFLYFTD